MTTKTRPDWPSDTCGPTARFREPSRTGARRSPRAPVVAQGALFRLSYLLAANDFVLNRHEPAIRRREQGIRLVDATEVSERLEVAAAIQSRQVPHVP